ncbi:ribonuclease H-like domain-containing protein [Mycena amicta]|nr:ribonuclease H-like domain-containing protein [Mycena amicta]
MVDTLQKWSRSGTLLIDGWEDELRRSLYGTAAARVDEPTIVMGLNDVTGNRGSAPKILEAAELAMAEMGIEDASCFLAAVTDNPNVMKVFRNLLEKSYPWLITLACWAHQLNTLIGEICRFPAAKAAFLKGNRVVTFFNGSHYWGGQLKIAALAEEITRGLKKDCASRWYALIVLLLSVDAHKTPLNTLVARPEARKATDGLSAVNADVVRIIQDHDNSFWPMIKQGIRIARPFVDVIAQCEGRAVTLADCMLNLLRAARQLSVLKDADDDDRAFKKHAHAVVDKRFRQMATPVHRLALFLHPLCRKFAVVDAPGFTLRDLKKTALSIAKDKWKWSKLDCQILASDIDEYGSCREPFAGGQKDAREWWKVLPVIPKLHTLKPFALAILSIVPHAAEIERLFSSCNGIQSPKRNSLAVSTFSKLAKVRSRLVEEAKARTPPKTTGRTKSKTADGPSVTKPTAEKSAPLEKDQTLEKWQAPLDRAGDDSEAVDGVESAFQELEQTLEEESDHDEADEDVDTDEELEQASTTTVASAKGKKKAAGKLSLMAGDIYDFKLVQKALDNVVPREEVQKVNVVRHGESEDWDIMDLL